MQFRVVTLNLEQDHKRWSERHPLISAEIAALKPDVIALNEVCVPLQTAKLLRDAAIEATGFSNSPQGMLRKSGMIRTLFRPSLFQQARPVRHDRHEPVLSDTAQALFHQTA